VPTDRTVLLARRAADVFRAAVLVSGMFMLGFGNFAAAGGFAVVFVVLLAPRALRISAPFDAAFCLALLAAMWAAAQQWYVTVVWMDEVVHFVTTGAAAAAAYLMLARLELLPGIEEQLRATRRFSLVLMLTILGLGLAAVWEFFEWLGQLVAPKDMHVGYDDTILDMMIGGVGSLLAGGLQLLWKRSPHRGASAAEQAQPVSS
jgi:hypothetical protein